MSQSSESYNVIFLNTGAVELFTKDIALPVELRALPYDVNSVMHFGDRDYSKNGHRTITFKNPNTQQNRIGLTTTDLKKISLVYGEECRKRDRQEKIELCQSYPGVVRKKRDVDSTGLKSLRVNPNITPPPAVGETDDNIDQQTIEHVNKLSASVSELGIDVETQEIVNQVHKAARQALKHARQKYCNNSLTDEVIYNRTKLRGGTDIISIIELITTYSTNVVENAITNLTHFCQNPDVLEANLRIHVIPCKWNDATCRQVYRSTKTGRVYYSTKHHPYIYQSTKHKGKGVHYSYDKMQFRSGTENGTEETTTEQIRRKRAAVEDEKTLSDEEKQNFKINTSEKTVANQKRRYFNQRSQRSGKDSFISEWAASALSDEKETDAPQESSEKGIEGLDVDYTKTYPQKVVQETADFGEKDINLKAQYGDETDTDIETTTTKRKSKSKEKLKIRDIEYMDKTLEKKNRSPKYKKRAREVPETIKMTKLNRDFYNERRWPEGIVRYVISPTEAEDYDLTDMRARLAAVGKILKKKTCVTLEEVTEEEAANHEDYLVIDTSPDYVTGRVGGKQHFGSIELFKGGQHKQHAAMMVMAMLGFYFEVARHDRDKYIRVHMRHVRPDKLHHFERIREEATLDTPYDFDSAMHPAWQFWRKIGKTGISTVATFKDRDPDGSVMRSLGQHDKLLSDGDIMKINSVYGVECFTDNDDKRPATKGTY